MRGGKPPQGPGDHSRISFPFTEDGGVLGRFGVNFWTEPRDLGEQTLFEYGTGDKERNRLALEIKNAELMLSVLRTTMAWNNQLAIAMPKKPLVGNFTPGFMLKLAHKDARLALSMMESLGVKAPIGKAAFGTIDEALRAGLGDRDVGVMLKMREEQAGVTVRLPPAAKPAS